MKVLRHLFVKAHRDNGGGSAVEFALIIVPVIVLLFGVLDFGLGIWAYNNLAEATDEGARFAIVRGQGARTGALLTIEVGPIDTGPPAGDDPYQEGPVYCTGVTTEDVVPVVCQYAFPLTPEKLKITVEWGCNVSGDPDNCSDNTNSVGQLLRVEAHYEYTPFVLNTLLTLVNPSASLNINMKSVTRMPIACCD